MRPPAPGLASNFAAVAVDPKEDLWLAIVRTASALLQDIDKDRLNPVIADRAEGLRVALNALVASEQVAA